MCDECGAEFVVYPSGPPFTVVKLQAGSIVILDSFDTEIRAEAFAAELHSDRLEEHAKFGQFKECANLVAEEFERGMVDALLKPHPKVERILAKRRAEARK
jgi:hypothetical protein